MAPRARPALHGVRRALTATSVAFFRNLNLGQPRSPRREELLDAVAERLAGVCDHTDRAVVRSVGWLADLGLDALPDGCELTLFDGPSPFPEALPWDPGRGDVTVLAADHLHAIGSTPADVMGRGRPYDHPP